MEPIQYMRYIFIFLWLGAFGQQKANDGKPIECGLQFRSTDSVVGASFYKPPPNQWVIKLYDSIGNILDSSISPISNAGFGGALFKKSYPPGPYTLSYYSASGDYTYIPNTYVTDTKFVAYTTKAGAGVYRYGMGIPFISYQNTSYFIKPVLKSVSKVNVSLSDLGNTFVLILPPDGGPVRFPDSTTLRKAIFGFDPPGPILDIIYPKDAFGVVYRITLYTWGNKREYKVNGIWTETPYK